MTDCMTSYESSAELLVTSTSKILVSVTAEALSDALNGRRRSLEIISSIMPELIIWGNVAAIWVANVEL